MSEFMSFEKIKIELFKIAGGNQTALIREASDQEYTEISKELLASDNEQVGFVTTEDRGLGEGSYDRLTMMGGELCINACLAMARSARQATSCYVGSFKINDREVRWRDFPEGPNIDLRLQFSVFELNGLLGKVVLLEDIGYRVTTQNDKLSKMQLQSLCNDFKMPAFGDIQREGARIKPYVYVQRTNTLIAETACGSGSIAAVLAASNDIERKQIRNMEQPTGQVISISGPKEGEMSAKFTISAMVEQIS